MKLKSFVLGDSIKVLDLKATTKIKGGGNGSVTLSSGGGMPPPIRGLGTGGII